MPSNNKKEFGFFFFFFFQKHFSTVSQTELKIPSIKKYYKTAVGQLMATIE